MILLFLVMWEMNKGKCGVCGDAYHLESPRPHEAGGSYAKGIISKFYAAGQVSNVLYFGEDGVYRLPTEIHHNFYSLNKFI